jgi:glutathione S-transferase
MAEKVHNWEVNRGSSVYFMKIFGILPQNPVLGAYAERCLARPAYAKALARDAEFTA